MKIATKKIIKIIIIFLLLVLIFLTKYNFIILYIENQGVKDFNSLSTYYQKKEIDSFVSDKYEFFDKPRSYSFYEKNLESIQISINNKYIKTINKNDKEKETTIENLIPNKFYILHIKKSNNYFAYKILKTQGQIRMLNVDGIYNVRDLGGWKSKNGRIRYGLIFRGSELDGIHNITITNDGVLTMKELGIKAEIDLRGDDEVIDKSPISNFASYKRFPIYSYTEGIRNIKMYKLLFQELFSLINENKPVYIHCWGGCDRTGTVIALIEGLLGVSEKDIIKDYELSSFSIFGLRKYNHGVEGTMFKTFIDYINTSYSGNDFQQKCKQFFYELGFSEFEIESFQEKMIEN